MKKLLFLLIPLFTFSQVTLEEIFSINSEDKFLQVMIENDFEEKSSDEVVSWSHSSGTSALFKQEKDSDVMGVFFLFPENVIGKNGAYDDLFDKVKDECNFSEVRDYLGDKRAFYICPDPNPNPELVELQKEIDALQDEPFPFKITDQEIAFAKINGIYQISFLPSGMSEDETIKMVRALIEMRKDQLKSEKQ